jgi:hypothetical protein
MVKRALLALALLATFSGCMGTGGLGSKVRKFNLTVVENRWAREGVFLGLNVLWVYRICTVLDLFVFNSIEFWSGENVINGRKPLVDLPPSAVEKIASLEIERARVERLSENDAKLHLDLRNGDHVAFDVLRDGETYTVSYLGRVFFQGKLGDALP